jgi:pyruvate dehydrogenase E2 component (dihydrolipoamide acetyltransferase)
VSTATAKTFVLPDLGEGLADADIIAWRVAVGDVIEADQIVVEVETAKATLELPSPYAGTVVELHADAGTTLPVGKPLLTIDTTDVASNGTSNGSGAVLVGYGTREVASTPAHTLASTSRRRPTPQAPRVISPLVRKLAREADVDLASLPGSGADGVILRRDVEAAARPAPTHSTTRETLTGVRRATAAKLSRSRREIPDVTTWVDTDATTLLEARATLNERADHVHIGTLALFARITVSALTRFPELNSSIESGDAGADTFTLVRHDAVHLGVAAQTDRGLVVPVISNAHEMSTRDLAAELTRLTDKAREGKLTPGELTGGTFTLNNYGVFGVDGSTPIINQPEAALLGIGRIADKPWAVDGRLEVRKVTQLSLTFDHRVCDGGTAGGFLRYVADCVEQPLTLLADL